VRKAKATYQDGKEEGIVSGFYEDGTLMREATYTAGVPNGPAKQYYPSGALHIEDTFRNGTVVHRKTYDESGKLLAEETR
jgi:antitoxin component YwqK of YwqJK toxin-antitoxin module